MGRGELDLRGVFPCRTYPAIKAWNLDGMQMWIIDDCPSCRAGYVEGHFMYLAASHEYHFGNCFN
jgi:hypothetical protein